ncbi:MAG: Eco57I restriction-modification methylase domain-containing protein [Leptolyngbyaceae cyanobacterium bins.59]|nr:Eco57I restriction-modification methylase domain-containing protein [Leptolyngbyaceae cyanobacterium bins.59]
MGDFCHQYRVLYRCIQPDVNTLLWEAKGQEMPDPANRFLLRVAFLYFLGLRPAYSLQTAWERAVFLVPHFFQDFSLALIPEAILTTIAEKFDRYSFNFQSLPTDPRHLVDPPTFCKAFETVTSVSDRKSRGIFHTPPDVVEYLICQSLLYWLQTTLPDISQADWIAFIQGTSLPAIVGDHALAIDRALAHIKILDPAVGAGVFPVAIVRHIGKMRQTLTPYLRLNSAQQASRTLAPLYVHTLHHSIYAVDLDLAAVEMTRIQLWLLLWEAGETSLPALPQVLWGDTLAIQQSQLFLESCFKSVFKQQQGFDWVIGNPPYIRIHKQDCQTRQYIRQHFESAQGDFDIYILFFEVGLRLLKPDGILAYITPDKFLVRNYGVKIRQLILQHSVLELFDISRREQTFAAATYPLMSILQKNDRTPQIQFKFASHAQKLFDALPITIEKQKMVARPTIDLCHPTDQALLTKIWDQSKRLSDMIDRRQIFCGTPRAKDYHSWENYVYSLEKLNKTADFQSLRLLVCAHLRPYQIQFQKRVRTLGYSIKEPYFTNVDNLINPQRWADFCLTPKLLIRGNDTRITAVLDEMGSVFIGIYGIKITDSLVGLDKYLLGILNSTLYQWVLAVQNPSIRIAGGFFSINAPHILNLPFKPISQPEQGIFETLVNRILELTHDPAFSTRPDLQDQVKNCQNSLDRLIYTLYQLTEDEIFRVESLGSQQKNRYAPPRDHDRSHPVPERQTPFAP